MASELTSSLLTDFKRVEHMAARLREAGQAWIRHYLIFLKEWLRVYKLAQKYKDAETIEKLKALGTCDGNRIDGSVVSKFNKIVGGAEHLLDVGDHLPPSREALYEFVCSYDKKHKRYTPKQFVQQYEITSSSSVRDLRGLRSRNPKSAGKASARAQSRVSPADIKKVIAKYGPDRVPIEFNPSSLKRLNESGSQEGLSVFLAYRDFDQKDEKDVYSLLLDVTDPDILQRAVGSALKKS